MENLQVMGDIIKGLILTLSPPDLVQPGEPGGSWSSATLNH